MTETFKKQAQLFIDAFPDVGRNSPVIPEEGKIDFINRSILRSIDFPSVADAEDQAVVFHEGINHPVISHA